MRVTWVQPEDLLAHELAASQAEGRDAEPARRRWQAAGGAAQPPPGGASPQPAPGHLRDLARTLLAELDRLPADPALSAREPLDLPEIEATWPARLELPFPEGRQAGWLFDRVHGGWLGRAAGCLLGKPVEKLPRDGIREILQATGRWPLRGYFTAKGLPAEVARRWPWNRRSAPTSLVENIRGMPEDDDLNFAMLALTLLERHGTGVTTGDVAQAWLSELPGGRVFTAERIAYRNLLDGLTPPQTATTGNPFREWIGAAIRADAYGWASPGHPRQAARLAWRDARLSHTRSGTYAAMFVAGMCAAALVCDTVDDVLAAGLSVIPAESRYAAAVRRGIQVAHAEPDLERGLDLLHAEFGHLHWVHAVNNGALTAFALTRGNGDFATSVCAAVTGGWDTDSVGATVGSVCGALTGATSLPTEWTGPLRNRVASTLPGFDGIGLDELARRTVAVIERVQQ